MSAIHAEFAFFPHPLAHSFPQAVMDNAILTTKITHIIFFIICFLPSFFLNFGVIYDIYIIVTILKIPSAKLILNGFVKRNYENFITIIYFSKYAPKFYIQVDNSYYKHTFFLFQVVFSTYRLFLFSHKWLN